MGGAEFQFLHPPEVLPALDRLHNASIPSAAIRGVLYEVVSQSITPESLVAAHAAIAQGGEPVDRPLALRLATCQEAERLRESATAQSTKRAIVLANPTTIDAIIGTVSKEEANEPLRVAIRHRTFRDSAKQRGGAYAELHLLFALDAAARRHAETADPPDRGRYAPLVSAAEIVITAFGKHLHSLRRQ